MTGVQTCALPILTASPATQDWLAGLVGLGPTVTLIGGQAAISGFVEQQVFETINGGGGGEPPPEPGPTATPVPVA